MHRDHLDFYIVDKSSDNVTGMAFTGLGIEAVQTELRVEPVM